jgi:hypothetical protein
MKKVILLLVLAVLSLNLVCAAPDYTMIPPQSLPTFTGSLDDPQVNIVYYDASGVYLLVEYEGVLYVFYL